MWKVYGLSNQSASDLIDAVSALGIGSGGKRFHWDLGAFLILVFSSDIEELFFRLAYTGTGQFLGHQLLVDSSERHRIDAALLQCTFKPKLLEIYRVWLPSDREHRQLLSYLNMPRPNVRGAMHVLLPI